MRKVYTGYVGIVIEMLSDPRRKFSSSNPLSGPDFIDLLEQHYDVVLKPTMLRQTINHIRNMGLAPIGSNNKGYFMCQEVSDYLETIEHMTHRIAGITAAKTGMERMVREYLQTSNQEDLIAQL